MFTITFTVLPTQTTELQTESSSYSSSASNRVDEFAQNSGSASSSGQTSAVLGERQSVTTSSFSAARQSGFSFYEEGSYVEENAGGGQSSSSGSTEISWDGAFTYASQADGEGGITVGSPMTGVIWTSTTSGETFTKNGSVLGTTTVSTVTAGTNVENLETVSTQTTILTTSGGSVSSSRLTIASVSTEEITAYSANGITHVWQPEFATILIPQENEIIWLLTADQDGPLQDVAKSYSSNVTIYPEKQFFEIAAVNISHDPQSGIVVNTTTDYTKINTFQQTTVRTLKSFILPLQTTSVNKVSVTGDSSTNTETLETRIGLSIETTKTQIQSWSGEIAGSVFSQNAITTTTESFFPDVFVFSDSSSFSNEITEPDGGFDFVSGITQEQGAFGGLRNFSINKAFYYTKLLEPVTAVSRFYDHGWFALPSASMAASDLRADGLTVSAPITLLANQTVRGVWPTTWSYVSNFSSVTASAGGGGISLTKKVADIDEAETTSGAWLTQGSAQTNVAEATRRAVVGGVQALENVTVLAEAGTFFTFNEIESGTQFCEGASILAEGNGVTGIAPAPNCLVGGQERFVVAPRNRTSLPD